MRYFTHYWVGTTFEDAKEWDDGEALLSLGSNLFQKRGVTAGDVIYVINFFQGDLYVVGRLVVDRVVGKTEARAILGRDDVWPADDQVIGREGSGTRLHFDSVLPVSDLMRIEFIASDGSITSPARNKRGQVDPQTFRGVREITRRTAEMFDTLLTEGTPPDSP